MVIVRWWDPMAESETSSRACAPPVDIFEKEGAVVVAVEVPGVERGRISVEVKDGVLTIRGERPAEPDAGLAVFLRRERPHGTFRRSFTLPPTIDADRVAATLRDGVLSVRLPGREKPKPKQVRVEVN